MTSFGGYQMNNSQQERSERPNNTERIIPLTIHKMNHLQQSGAKEIDDIKVTDVQIVGRLTSIDQQENKVVMGIDDSTGHVLLDFYHQKEDALPQMIADLFKLKKNSYVKAYTLIRGSMFILTHMSEIKEYDEVTSHFLKVFLASETRKKGYLEEEPVTYQKIKTQGQNNSQKSTYGTQVVQKSMLDLVWETIRSIKNAKSEDTVTIQEIHQHELLRNKAKHEIKDRLSELANSGRIYTVGTDQFMVIDN